MLPIDFIPFRPNGLDTLESSAPTNRFHMTAAGQGALQDGSGRNSQSESINAAACLGGHQHSSPTGGIIGRGISAAGRGTRGFAPRRPRGTDHRWPRGSHEFFPHGGRMPERTSRRVRCGYQPSESNNAAYGRANHHRSSLTAGINGGGIAAADNVPMVYRAPTTRDRPQEERRPRIPPVD